MGISSRGHGEVEARFIGWRAERGGVEWRCAPINLSNMWDETMSWMKSLPWLDATVVRLLSVRRRS